MIQHLANQKSKKHSTNHLNLSKYQRKMPRIFSLRFPYIKIKAMVFLTIIIVMYILHLKSNKSESAKEKNTVELQYVVVHIDLKGAPPKLDYLRSLLPVMKDNGVNGLLIEYEDMFPYEGRLANLSARNCYDQFQLKDFIQNAHELGFEIIPLIQTFGHLEYALKLKEFRLLRENLAYPDSICPSNVESRVMIQEMLEQVIIFHASILPLKYIHVGCDEVYLINECVRCRSKGVSNKVLFIDHVRFVSNVIANLSPNTTVMIWDDMLRKIKYYEWETIDAFNNVEPVYWHYSEWNKFPHVNLMSYRTKFKNTWLASAFKGADGKTAAIPNLAKRLTNHYSLMRHLQTTKIPGKNEVYRFKGIILTGWSRYSHMDPLCELLPSSIPSLIVNLRMISIFKSGIVTSGDIDNIDEFFSNHLFENDRHLSCDKSFKPIASNRYVNDHCNFNGYKLFSLLNIHIRVLNSAKSMLQSDEILALEYYFQSNYAAKKKKELHLHIKSCVDKLALIEQVEDKIALSMKPYFEDYVIVEYINYKSYQLKKRLSHLVGSFKSSLLFDGAWERRPAPTARVANILFDFTRVRVTNSDTY